MYHCSYTIVLLCSYSRMEELQTCAVRYDTASNLHL